MRIGDNTRIEVRIAFDLAADEQYERHKPFTEAIVYRVERIVATGYRTVRRSSRGTLDVQVTVQANCVGPRRLKSGADGEVQQAAGWNDIPEGLRTRIEEHVERALSTAVVPTIEAEA